MVLILNKSKRVENNFKFFTAVDLNKCLNLSLYMRAHISDLPCNISTIPQLGRLNAVLYF